MNQQSIQLEELSIQDEGGLNLGRVLAAIYRKLYLVVVTMLTVTILAGLKSQLENPIFTSEFELLTEPVTVESQVISTTNPESLSSREDIIALEVSDVRLRILESPKILLPVVEKLRVKYPDISFNSLTARLELELPVTKGSNVSGNIIKVKYSSPNPQEVKDVLEMISKIYLNYSLETIQTDITEGINFLNEQTPELQQRVNSLQRELELLRKKNNLIDPIEQSKLLLSQINSFSERQKSVRAELIEAQLKKTALEEEMALFNEELYPSIIEHPRYKELTSQILAIDIDIARESALLTENSLEMKIILERRKKLEALLKQEIKNIYTEKKLSLIKQIQDLKLQEQSLNQSREILNSEIKLLSTLTRQYSDIQRELEIATNNYTQFIAKREALKIDNAQKQFPWEILTPPKEPEAQRTSTMNNLILGSILGLLLGVGFALLLDKIGNVIYTTKEIRNLTNLPILGTIPYHNYRVEAFNSLFNNLYHLHLPNIKHPIRSLVVTSADLGEGKSTITFYLGIIAANVGKRVLLVDANLRNPNLHKRLVVTNELGLTEVLSQSDLDVNDFIQRKRIAYNNKNLYVLTAGKITQDPTKILNSSKIPTLMKQLETDFDLVIYDTSNLLLTDAQLVAANTDGILLVVGLGKVKASLLEEALAQIRLSRIPVLGIVANSVTRVSSSNLVSTKEELIIW